MDQQPLSDRAQNQPLLDIRGLDFVYQIPAGEVRAVVDLDLTVRTGESVGIVGESGSGKSTLGSAILQLLPPNARVARGSIVLTRKDGSRLDLVRARPEELRRVRWLEVATVFQKAMSCLSPVHRISTQFVDVLRVHQPGLKTAEAMARARELFAAVNLPPQALRSYPHQLSGGMMQRAMIALSLAHSPRLLILDEATTALDVITQGQILAEMRRLKQDFDLTTLVITHDISVIGEICDRVAVMYAGQLMEVGPTRAILTRPAHPYTRALVASFPKLTGARTRLSGIEGSLPDLVTPPGGCLFAPRCREAEDRCHQTRPEMRPVPSAAPNTTPVGTAVHEVRCHHV